MKNNEIIKKAQEICGEYVTGYKADVSENSVREICRMIWVRSANLGYSFFQWHDEMLSVLGKAAFAFWYDTILDFRQEMMEANKYFVFHGTRYCTK